AYHTSRQELMPTQKLVGLANYPGLAFLSLEAKDFLRGSVVVCH
ncbi:unnamed protein product, partial [marine sediment metagenome]